MLRIERRGEHTVKSNKNKYITVLVTAICAIASGLPAAFAQSDDSAAGQQPTFPCESAEAFKDFDFWLGEWDVHLADGTVAGHNVIAKEERGCVLTEHWTGASGGTGMSVNYVDGMDGKWVQVWNSAAGTQINIRGGMTDEGMAMEGTIHSVSTGTTAPFRALWTPLPDGRVRQYFEQSNDGGKTWTPWFEGFYTRKKN
jgi:hypothetical protein